MLKDFVGKKCFCFGGTNYWVNYEVGGRRRKMWLEKQAKRMRLQENLE